MKAGEVGTKHFFGSKEVCEVCFGVVLTDVAVTGFVRLAEITRIFAV